MKKVARGHSGGLFFCAGSYFNCNHIKGLAKFGRQDPVRPGAVREYEIQETAFLTGGLLLEEVGGTAGQLQQSDPLVKVGLVGGLVVGSCLPNTGLLRPPLPDLLVIELGADPPSSLSS